MTIKVIREFYDKTENLKLREVGEEIKVTDKRGITLIDKKLAIKVVTKKK